MSLRVIVTGANGFVGTHLVKVFIRYGFEVIAAVDLLAIPIQLKGWVARLLGLIITTSRQSKGS